MQSTRVTRSSSASQSKAVIEDVKPLRLGKMEDGCRMSDVKQLVTHEEAENIIVEQLKELEMKRYIQTMQEEDISLHQSVGGGEEGYDSEDDDNEYGRLNSDEEGSDYEYQDLLKGRKKKKQQPQRRSTRLSDIEGKKASLSSPGRGRGRPSTGATPRNNRDPTIILNLPKNYKITVIDPADLCPPPPPKKLKGGRRSMIKEALPVDEPEAEVQLACLGLKKSPIAKTADVRKPMIPFTGTVFSPLLRSMYLHEVDASLRTTVLKCTYLQATAMGTEIDDDVVQILTQNLEEFDLGGILKSEIMNYVVHSTTMREELVVDPMDWIKDLAQECCKFERIKFRAADENPNLQLNGISYADMYSKIQEAKVVIKNKLLTLILIARNNVCITIKEGKERIEDIRRKKYFIQESYENLYDELKNRDAKFDEMSITGVRCIKMIMDGPYFKTEDGLLSFQLPIDNEAQGLMHRVPFHTEKQKWTSKDMLALKQIIKECIVTKRIDDLNARYLELLNESDIRRIEEMSREGKPSDVIYQPPQKRRRGRPTKEETSQRDKYGAVFPVLQRTPSFAIAYSISPKQLSEWRTGIEKRLRNMSFDTLFKEKDAESLIDWDDVALKLMIRTKKLRLETDCRLTYQHEVDPKVNCRRLTMEETKKIKALYEDEQLNWDEIAKELNQKSITLASFKDPNSDANTIIPLHTPFQYFAKYVSKVVPPSKPEWTDEMDDKVKTALAEYPAHWKKVAAMLNNEAITKKVVVERYKKAIIPMLKIGPFSRIEDCLLLLTMQRLKDFMSEEGHFGSLLAYLPWRYETTWRDRAHNLFNDWIVPWTIEEDRLLLDLAEKMNKNWQQISEHFHSFKNRKGCLTRFKILKRNLGLDKNKTLEEYHEAYSMTRYNVFQYRHLKEIISLLKKMQNVKVSNRPTKTLLKRVTAPTEEELQVMLVTYDRGVMNECIISLEKYIAGRDEYWETWINKNGERKKTFDRRTFHPDNPQSVASTLHIRGLKLKPKSQFKDLTDFESQIYLQYGRFLRTKPLREKTKNGRPHLPPASFFCQWSAVQRIIANPGPIEEDENEPSSKKWSRWMENMHQGKEKKQKKKATNKKRKKADSTDSSSEEEEELPEFDTDDSD